MPSHIDLPQQDFLDRCSALLSKIPGVFSAVVRTDGLGEISDIHVLASTQRNSKQISRDIQAALSAAYNLNVDHRVISIAQIAGELDGKSAFSAEDLSIRLQFAGISYQILDQSCHYSVILRNGDAEYVGSCDCANSVKQKRRAAAQATLNAIEQFFGRSGILSLGTVQAVDVDGYKLIITVIDCTLPGHNRPLVGAVRSYEEDGEQEAVVRSTLDAINRTINRMK
ncbi:MAG: hypothetical protein Q4E13_07065 [Clostridia bacterium]|nr:hypothetical protein [Clostridia bacterium]